jgi:hypothetical protein
MGALTDAALAITRHYPGGAAALGARMGKTNLADEVNPNLPRSKLGADDMVMMEILANDYRCLYAHALECRHFPPVPMPDVVDGEAPCMQTLARMTREFGALIAEVSQDLADGKVTTRELAEVRRQWAAMVSAGQAMVGQMAAMNAALMAMAPGEGV